MVLKMSLVDRSVISEASSYEGSPTCTQFIVGYASEGRDHGLNILVWVLPLSFQSTEQSLEHSSSLWNWRPPPTEESLKHEECSLHWRNFLYSKVGSILTCTYPEKKINQYSIAFLLVFVAIDQEPPSAFKNVSLDLDSVVVYFSRMQSYDWKHLVK